MNRKERMLNAYRGKKNDRFAVAPELWSYYPAKLMKAKMVEFEREIPFWKSLQYAFNYFQCEGWGSVFPDVKRDDCKVKSDFVRIGEGRYRETTITEYNGRTYTDSRIYSDEEPSWEEKSIVTDLSDLAEIMDLRLSTEVSVDCAEMNRAYESVGNDYLLEVCLGVPFFDFIAAQTGFENAIMYFMDEDESVLAGYLDRYIEYTKFMIGELVKKSPYESYFLGCSYSCNSLIGPNMWRKWDKKFITAVASELHKHGKLLHIHFHGKSHDNIKDFVDCGCDAVCPFERQPGGDIIGIEGLKEVRKILDDKVTFNGNVHTVETLINGKPEDVIREVREIKEAFYGSNRCIIGTGDQVGKETPEEYIRLMIEEAHKPL